MANQVIITFEGSLDSAYPNFKIHNGTNKNIRTVAFSGKTAQFPITWDKIGDMETSDDVTLSGTKGEDTEVYYMHFYNFKPGTTVSFKYGDLDYTGDSQTLVLVSTIEGTRVYAESDRGYLGIGEFKVVERKMQAALTL